MKIFFIVSQYWTGSGSSKPQSFSMLLTRVGVAFLPARRWAGSELGIRLKIAKTRTETANRTSTIPARRLTMKRAIRSLPRPPTRLPRRGLRRTFERGSRASRRPSPKTLSESTVSMIRIPGAKASSGEV